MGKIEIKVNKEIMDYKEIVYFGLSLRQTILCGTGLVLAVIVGMFLAKGYSDDIRMILGALTIAPFGAFAFVTYNGMKMEDIIKALVRMIRTPAKLPYRSSNLYFSLSENTIHKLEKEMRNAKCDFKQDEA